MKSGLITSFFLVLCSSLFCAQESVVLQPLWKVGDTFSLKEETNKRFKILVKGEEQQRGHKETVTATLAILDIDSAKNARARVTITDFFAESDLKEDPLDPFFWDYIRKFISGETFDVVLTPEGKVTKISGHEAWISCMEALDSAETISSDLTSEDELRNWCYSKINFFRLDPLTLGQSWTKPLLGTAGDENVSSDTSSDLSSSEDSESVSVTFTLSKIQDKLLEIDVAYELPLSSTEDKDSKLIYYDTKGTGKIVLDRKTGWISSAKLTKSKQGIYKKAGVKCPVTTREEKILECKKLN